MYLSGIFRDQFFDVLVELTFLQNDFLALNLFPILDVVKSAVTQGRRQAFASGFATNIVRMKTSVGLLSGCGFQKR